MLHGDRVALRAPEDADMPLLACIRNDVPLQASLLALPRPNDLRRVDEWTHRRLSEPDSLFFVVADRESDAALGFIQLVSIDFVHRTGCLGICLAEASRAKGCGSEALRLLERYVQDVFGIRKIVLSTLATNTPAISFYEKHGYASVGTHREHFYHAGNFRDVLVMEKLLVSAAGRKA